MATLRPIHILGITGSLRRSSHNTALLRAAASRTGANVRLEIATLHGIPLYDGDLEQEYGIPVAVEELKARIANSDALLIATPEYNSSVPGVLKNAFDWMSRQAEADSRIFANRSVAVIGASTSSFGTLRAQGAWLPILKSLGMHQWLDSSLLVSRSDRAFGADGMLADEAVSMQLREFLHGFAQFVRAGRHDDNTPVNVSSQPVSL